MTARRRRRRRGAPGHGAAHFGPNMTPMVDVVMVILIFFMASAAFVGEEWFLSAGIPVEAAPGQAASDAQIWELPAPRIEIALDADDAGLTLATSAALHVQRQPLAEVVARIRALPKDLRAESTEVLIRPSARVPYRDIVSVREACHAAGLVQVGISVTAGSG